MPIRLFRARPGSGGPRVFVSTPHHPQTLLLWLLSAGPSRERWILKNISHADSQFLVMGATPSGAWGHRQDRGPAALGVA